MDALPCIGQMRIEPATVGFTAYPPGDDEAGRIGFRQSLTAFVASSTDWMLYHCDRDASGGWHSAHVVPFLPADPKDV
ncbi:hypothetical protein [uncultured Paracoccus sp.]|uniref:hypothetical protein n=1 Tax=uncultured Paracoccus sp. TaxID=189685 RepID=UPI0025D53722|nr:hypothetical protein [uncultured Paracoccus sp.]